MAADPPLKVRDRASVSEARERVRAVARAAGLSEIEVERVALAVSELAQNQLDHARHGQIDVRTVTRGGVAGVEIEAADRGTGLVEPATAIAALLPGKGLGVGLAGVRRAVDEFDVDVRIGESTTLTVRRFAAPVRPQPEVAVMGRGLDAPSGDHAVVVRRDDVLWIAAIDGGGHGPEARAAADLAADVAHARLAEFELQDVLAEMHAALRDSRGAACSLAAWDVGAGRVRVCGVGNVAVRLYDGRGQAHSFSPAPGLLGVRMQVPPRVRDVPTPLRAALLLATDGISTRSDPVPPLVARSPVHLAQEVLRVAAKDHDDALVVVAR